MSGDYLTGNSRCPICSGHHPINAPCFLSTNWIPLEKTPMTPDIKELVRRLRTFKHRDANAAADALEALAGEVERLKEERDAAITDRFDAAAERIKAVTAERDRLAGEVETAKSQFKALQMVTSKEHEDTRAERDRLKAALETIAHDNVPREVFIVWRTDGSNSKHDKCQHMRMMYEDCGNCTALFARKALGDAS